MANLQQIILETLDRATRGAARGGSLGADIVPLANRTLEESLTTVARQLDQLREVSRTQAEAIGDNTQAVTQNTLAQASKGSSAAARAASAASGFLGGGLTLLPLISGIVSLFRSKPEPPPPLLPYVPPAPRHLQGAVSGGGLVAGADYGQDGLPRVAGAPAPSVTVRVEAMDARSFLDHSSEIARAVRQAMLGGHSLNDVLSEM